MTDELNEIIARQDKLALDKYADARGVKLDRRKSFASMVEDFEAEQQMDAAMNSGADAKLTDAEISEPNSDSGTLEEPGTADAPAASAGELTEAAADSAGSAARPKQVSISSEDMEEMARSWAATFAREIRDVAPVADGLTLRIRLVTRHGTSIGDADVAKWTRAEVEKALAAIKPQMA